MKKILFIAAILFSSPLSSLKAQQPDAVYKLLRYEWTVNADGTSDYHYRHEVQILRNRALTAYADKGETFVVYNPDLENLTVNEVYTIQKDGKRIDMPQNAFVYQLPEECADCGRFNHMRELAMVHTGMELGCTIVVDYTIHRQYNLLYERIPLQRECPVEKLEVTVNYPEDIATQFDITGVQYLPSDKVTRVSSVTQKEGQDIRRLQFTFSDMQQAPREPYMPTDIIPTLHLFNGTPVHTPAFDQTAFSEAADAVGQVMKGDNDKENITAIRDYVVDNLHLNDIHPSHLGYVHSTPFEVWATGCGTATDKAVFLTAVLNNEGYSARVMGENYDQVGVMIDTVEYRLDVRNKTPIEINGEAKDEVAILDQTQTLDATTCLDTLEDGFYGLRCLTPLPGEPAVQAKALALTRTTPLVGTSCDLRSNVTYTLPKGFKLVGGTVSQKLSYPGVGSLEISIKQSGKKLLVRRSLIIEKSVIPVEDYAHYRQLLATWQNGREQTTLLRAK